MRCRVPDVFALILLSAVPAVAQQPARPYTEGPVTDVQFIRVKFGHLDEYMSFLAGPYKQSMEEQRKAGVITGWAVYASDRRDEEDWNIALTTVYKNMAAMDNLRDRVDPIQNRVYGSLEKTNEAAVKRSEMRDIVGNRLLRQLIIR
jgi:hypothetical protein